MSPQTISDTNMIVVQTAQVGVTAAPLNEEYVLDDRTSTSSEFC